MKHKLFISIQLPHSIKEILVNAQSQLEQDLPELVLIPAENLHITLKFIGLVDQKNIASLIMALNQLEMTAFHIFLEQLELQQKHDHGLIWCKVAAHNLDLLVKKIEELLVSFIEPETRNFNGHITIARFHRINNVPALKTFIENYSFNNVFFTADQFCLMESISSLSGVSYRILASYNFL